MNAGTVDGGSTEPATTALVTYVGGDWDSTTTIYTAPVGADMTEAVVGRYASLYHDGAVVPTTGAYMVGRISVVNVGTRQITVGAVERTLFGTLVATGTANRSLKIGGAWAGPSGAVTFPMTFLTKTISGSNFPIPRVNYKNDQTYTMTATIAFTLLGPVWHWGYTSTYGDGGYAVLQGATTGAAYIALNGGTSTSWNFAYWDIRNNGATGVATGVSLANESLAYRCKISGMRGFGIQANGSSGGCIVCECEAYGNNLNAGTSVGGIGGTGNGLIIRCVSRDNTAANASGFSVSGIITILDCIAYDNAAWGFQLASAAFCVAIGCTAYSNSGGGFQTQNGGDLLMYVENSVAVDNTGYGLTFTPGSTRAGVMFNNAFGDNSLGNIQHNTIAAVIESGTVTLGAGVRPWVDAVNGHFSINHSSVRELGRGEYLQGDGGVTRGYRDIGSAQSRSPVAPTLAIGV